VAKLVGEGFAETIGEEASRTQESVFAALIGDVRALAGARDCSPPSSSKATTRCLRAQPKTTKWSTTSTCLTLEIDLKVLRGHGLQVGPAVHGPKHDQDEASQQGVRELRTDARRRQGTSEREASEQGHRSDDDVRR
jgi:hypothetical protein